MTTVELMAQAIQDKAACMQIEGRACLALLTDDQAMVLAEAARAALAADISTAWLRGQLRA